MQGGIQATRDQPQTASQRTTTIYADLDFTGDRPIRPPSSQEKVTYTEVGTKPVSVLLFMVYVSCLYLCLFRNNEMVLNKFHKATYVYNIDLRPLLLVLYRKQIFLSLIFFAGNESIINISFMCTPLLAPVQGC